MRRLPFFILIVNTMKTWRPLPIRPTASNRASASAG
jgi:hypothetical protein